MEVLRCEHHENSNCSRHRDSETPCLDKQALLDGFEPGLNEHPAAYRVLILGWPFRNAAVSLQEQEDASQPCLVAMSEAQDEQ